MRTLNKIYSALLNLPRNNYFIGAGSVIRGQIAGGSVVMGNPAKTLMTIEDYARVAHNRNSSWILESDAK